jgi:hypothetical protein
MVLQPKSEAVDRRFQAKVRFESCLVPADKYRSAFSEGHNHTCEFAGRANWEDGYDPPRVVRLWRAGSKTAPSESLKLPRANQSDLLRSPVTDVIEVG